MVSRFLQVRWLSLLCCLAVPVLAGEPRPDIRVAIDISGSMKKNDPQGLRTPALKMLVGLMPDGMDAGVWTFGQFVNMQVKHGRVDAAWRKRAQRAADQIHSRGKFTNIEEAIQRASFNWQKADPRFNRSLILLTDGMVDISRDADVNQASRKRILEYWIPRLKKAKVRLHSVALSQGVDQALLSALSADTGGWYEQVDDAEQLQRVFLRLFEKSARRDSVPLKGNVFHIDAQVEDMTLLVFHQPNARALKITTPKGEDWKQQQVPGTVTWFHEAGYDLVTVHKPMPGEWRLATTSDADNRVLVVTNLKLKVDAMPEHLLAGENIDVLARLVEKDKVVAQMDFLKLVQFSVLQHKQGEPDAKAFPLLDNGESNDLKAADGHYGKRLTASHAEGEYTLIVRADGATFQREQRHTFHVYADLASVSLEKKAQGFKLAITPQRMLLDKQSIALTLKREDKKTTQWQQQQGVWHTLLPAALENSTISIVLKATRHGGAAFEKVYTRKLKGDAATAAKAATHEQTASTANKEEEKKHEKDSAGKQQVDKTQTDEPQAQQAEIKWSLVIWLTVIINLLVALVAVILWLVVKKRRARAEQQENVEMKL